jgi:hypothetical protein
VTAVPFVVWFGKAIAGVVGRSAGGTVTRARSATGVPFAV